jgi:hypothetical protein
MAHDDGKLLCVPEDKIYQHMSIAKKCADCAMSGSVISCLCLGSTGFVVDTYVDLSKSHFHLDAPRFPVTRELTDHSSFRHVCWEQ